MKSFFKISLIIILIILVFPMVKKWTETKEYQIQLHMYKSEDFSNPINRYFRLIPERYLCKYESTIVADSLDYQILRVDDLILGVPKHSYLVYHKKGNRINDLMNHSLVIDALNDGFVKEDEIERYYDFVVNKKVFNDIYSNYEKKDKQLAYLNLFRTSFDPTTFRLIETKSDIDSVLKYRPKSEGNIIDFELNPENVNPSSLLADYDFIMHYNHDDEIYYWYFDEGINYFKFEFNKNDDIVSIKHRFIGYLGNEIMHL